MTSKSGRKLTRHEIESLAKRINQENYHQFGPYVKFEDDGTVGLKPAYPTDRKYRILSMFEFLEGCSPIMEKEEKE
jgi:hypothetical protein